MNLEYSSYFETLKLADANVDEPRGSEQMRVKFIQDP